MGLKIGSVFLELLADGARLGPQVQAEAQKAGDAGAQTLGQRITRGFKSEAPRAFGLAASAAFGIATKGALELENIQVDLQRETGLTADAARDATQAINDIAGRNVTPLLDVADAFARVHNDIGLTGQAAVEATDKFTKFGRATKQGPADAVAAFDDILDAWGLTADHAGGIMDKLVVSHQRYGGSIEENERALKELAPQLSALNVDVDGGIALLNLFAASGIDSSKATFALNTAVQKLKPGQSLDDLIAQVSAIEDPTLRAQKAVELFGARGGVALANVLKPGIDSLDDFAVSEADAAGATEKAADVLDTSLSGRVRKALSEAGAALRGFGQDFGPAVTGIASLGSLAGAVFPGLGSRIAKSVGGGLVGAFKKTVAPALASAVAGGVTDGVAEGASKAATSSALGNATGKLGSFMGSKLGKTLSVAFAAVAVVEVINTYNEIQDGLNKQSEQIGTDVGNQIVSGTTESLQQSKAALETGIKQLSDLWYNPFAGGQKDALQKQLDAVDAELKRRAAVVPATTVAALDHGEASITAAATRAVRGIPRSVHDAAEDARSTAGKIPDSIASGVLERQSAVTDAMSTLRDLMKNALSPSKQIARDIGILTSKTLAKALNDGRPEVRAEAHRVQAMAEQELAQLIAGGGKAGKKAMAELQTALHSKNPAIREAAQRVQAIVQGKFDGIDGTKPGMAAGDELASGITKKQTKIGNAAYNIGTNIAGRLIAGIVVTGEHASTAGGKIRQFATGGIARGGEPVIVGERGWELAVPEQDMRVFSHEQSVAMLTPPRAGGGDTYHITVPLQGVLQAQTPRDVVHELQRIGRSGLLGPRTKPAVYPVPG